MHAELPITRIKGPPYFASKDEEVLLQTQREQLKRLTTDLAIVFVELFGTRVAPATEM